MILNPLLDFVFPNSCLECQRLLADRNSLLCLPCYYHLPFTHWKWGETNPMYEKLNAFIPIENACSLLYFYHDNATQKILHALKYHNRQTIGIWLAEEWMRRLTGKTENIGGICMIPIHPKKLKSRGYNQNEVLAKQLSNHLQIPFFPELLKRTKHQKSQTKMHRTERLNRLENTFCIDKIPEKIQHILLIDDICTTGSTLLHCGKLLLSRKIKVSILTIAYAI